jgi:hypothetical protein
LTVGHHRRCNGTGRRRLNVLVNYLPRYVFTVAGGLAVIHVDVVVLVDVVARLTDRACVVVYIPVCIVGRAVHALVDRAVARVGVDVPVGVIRCAVAGVLVDVCHRARIDILVHVGARCCVLIDVCHRPRIDVLVHVRVGVRTSGRVIVVVRVCASGRIGIGIVRRAVGCRVVDV